MYHPGSQMQRPVAHPPCRRHISGAVDKLLASLAVRYTVAEWLKWQGPLPLQSDGSVVGHWFRFSILDCSEGQRIRYWHQIANAPLHEDIFYAASMFPIWIPKPLTTSPQFSTAFSSEKVRKRFLVSLVDSKKVHPWVVVAMEIQDPSPSCWGVGRSKGQGHQDNRPPKWVAAIVAAKVW